MSPQLPKSRSRPSYSSPHNGVEADAHCHRDFRSALDHNEERVPRGSDGFGPKATFLHRVVVARRFGTTSPPRRDCSGFLARN